MARVPAFHDALATSVSIRYVACSSAKSSGDAGSGRLFCGSVYIFEPTIHLVTIDEFLAAIFDEMLVKRSIFAIESGDVAEGQACGRGVFPPEVMLLKSSPLDRP